MDIVFNLRRKSNGWYLIKVKGLFTEFHFVPKSHQFINHYPTWLKEILRNGISAANSTNIVTFNRHLDNNHLKYFVRNNQFYLGDLKLECSTSLKEKNQDRISRKQLYQKISKLTFNHKLDNPLFFKQQFYDAYATVDADLAIMEFYNFVLPEHKEIFKAVTPQNLEKLFDQFILTYVGTRDEKLISLKETDDSKGISNMVNERFRYYDEKFYFSTFQSKFNYFVQDLPEKYKSLFNGAEKYGKVFNNKNRIITYLNTKLNEIIATVSNEMELEAEVNPIEQIQQIQQRLNRPAFLNG